MLAIGRSCGRYELAHSLVSSGVLGWTGLDGCQQKQPLVFAPVEVATTSAACVGAAIVSNLESLFGSDLEQFLAKTAKLYRVLSIMLVGDAATSNRKFVSHLIPYCFEIASAHDLVMTMSWSPCFLHQLARILLIHLEHQRLSAALFSISRLHQHSETRKKTLVSLQHVLHARFDFQQGQRPPACAATQADFRRHLESLLSETACWDGELDSTRAQAQKTERIQLLERLLRFFNGDLSDGSRISHFCNGCHRDRQHAVEEAVLRVGSLQGFRDGFWGSEGLLWVLSLVYLFSLVESTHLQGCLWTYGCKLNLGLAVRSTSFGS